MAWLLGLPLHEALRRLRLEGVEPEVTVTRAPRRPEEVGALRVVRAQDAGKKLTAAAFVDKVKEAYE